MRGPVACSGLCCGFSSMILVHDASGRLDCMSASSDMSLPWCPSANPGLCTDAPRVTADDSKDLFA